MRTKRIKSKYPWHQIPEQFIWAARDDNGEVWAFTCQPVYDAEAGIWWFGEGNAAKNDVWEVTQADKPRNAAATLEARPVPKEANA